MHRFFLPACLFVAYTTCLPAQPGFPDAGFGSAGHVTTAFGNGEDYGQAVAVQPDGKIVVAGFTDVGSSDNFAVARYKVDGSLDATFDNDGRVTTSFGSSNDRAYALAIQPDGKIVVAGYTSVNGEYDFAVARYKANGGLDNTFYGSGKLTTNLGGLFDKAYAVAIQPDGKILVGGTVGQNADADFGVVRYQTNGLLDMSFGTGGIAKLTIGTSYDELHALALQPDGKIVAAGFTANAAGSYEFAAARFTAAGLPDPAFQGTGRTSTAIGISASYGQAVAVQPDGYIVVVGYSAISPLQYGVTLTRYQPDGSPDPGFGDNGVVVSNPSGSFDEGLAVALQPDGKIVAGGFVAGAGHPDFALLRYLPNGTPDAGFGLQGTARLDFSGGTDQVTSLAIAPDGKLVAAGRSESGMVADFAVARFISGLLVGTTDHFEPFTQLFVTPNPLEEQAVFTYELDRAALVNLCLYTMSGRLVQSFFEKEQREKGPQSEVLLLKKNIPPGHYLLVLQSNEGSHALAVVKR